MENIINLGIPHVGEQIFEDLNTKDLIQYLKVSQAWKALAENVLFQRWKGKLFETCEEGKTEIVRIILERSKNEEVRLMMLRKHFHQTALLAACGNGHKDVVRLLLAHPSSRAIDFNDTGCYLGYSTGTALILACKYGHKDIVKLLLNHQNSQTIDLMQRTLRVILH